MEKYFAVVYKTHATNNVFPLIAIYEKVIYMLITMYDNKIFFNQLFTYMYHIFIFFYTFAVR